ncbi:MAG: hypothetical protein FWH17_10565 [Oscillospiraceae bacterium]|nr:hypothetical protein [Oscillospiraceae bacterium]
MAKKLNPNEDKKTFKEITTRIKIEGADEYIAKQTEILKNFKLIAKEIKKINKHLHKEDMTIISLN